MRLEFNPRAMCYNLYCDTREEHDKLKQLMEKPLTAVDIKSIDNMIYADTDSIKRTIGYNISQEERRYIENDVIATKQFLNSLYGKVVTDMIKDYIVVHPTGSCEVGIIFKDKVTGVFKHDDGTADLLLESGSMFALFDKYEDIIKRIL